MQKNEKNNVTKPQKYMKTVESVKESYYKRNISDVYVSVANKFLYILVEKKLIEGDFSPIIAQGSGGDNDERRESMMNFMAIITADIGMIFSEKLDIVYESMKMLYIPDDQIVAWLVRTQMVSMFGYDSTGETFKELTRWITNEPSNNLDKAFIGKAETVYAAVKNIDIDACAKIPEAAKTCYKTIVAVIGMKLKKAQTNNLAVRYARFINSEVAFINACLVKTGEPALVNLIETLIILADANNLEIEFNECEIPDNVSLLELLETHLKVAPLKTMPKKYSTAFEKTINYLKNVKQTKKYKLKITGFTISS